MPRDSSITHKIMSAIRLKDTKPDLLLRKALWHRGLRYKVNCRSLPGRPDIVFSKVKLDRFCDGDYWHGHYWALRGMTSLEDELKSYSDYWKHKILGNVSRDRTNSPLLKSEGWAVIRIWKSEIKSDVNK